MLRLTICLLLGTAAFAQYQTGNAPSSLPMDFNDNIYNRDIQRPPTDRLFFNFEQRRIDQPPQFETRDENLGQYMGRPRTTSKPIPTRHGELDNLYRIPVSTGPPTPYDPSKWGPIAAHLPSSLPDAPAMPKWMDLSDDSFRNHVRHQPSRYSTEHYQQSVATQAPATQWHEPARQSYQEESMQQYQEHPQAFSDVEPYRTAETMTHAYAKPVENRQPMSAEEFVRPKARGNHKFNWADVNTPGPMAMSSTAAPVPQKGRNPPPSFPTLSPWQDGFGK